MHALRLTILLALLLTTLSGAWAAEIYILANTGVPDKTLEKASLERIYLGKKSQWSNGTRIVPVVLKSGSTHTAFVKRFLDRDVSQFSTYWKQAVFTGRGMPPKAFDTEAEIVDYISSTPGAIGYTSFIPSTKPVIRITIK
ncbi:substrate-binding domain-containing protein [bacterium]|nr:substrate-binding domain-containing protein [bacterium]